MKAYLTSFSSSSKHSTALCPILLPQSNICTTQTSTHSNTKLFINTYKACKKRGHTNLPRLKTSYELKYLQLNQRMRAYLTSFSFLSKHGTALCLILSPQPNIYTTQTSTHSNTKLFRCAKRVKSEAI
jgi:hypothetical protein